jgi:hypothetical protein
VIFGRVALQSECDVLQGGCEYQVGGAAVDLPSPWLEPVRLDREESLISLSAASQIHKSDRTYQVRLTILCGSNNKSKGIVVLWAMF